MTNKTPTWAMITGILMLMIGGCGIKNSIQSINIREMMSISNSFIEKLDDSSSEEADTITDNQQMGDRQITTKTDTVSDADTMGTQVITNQKDDEKSLKDLAESMLYIPEETEVWIVRFGYSGLLFSVLYIFGGLFLLIKRNFSIKLAYAALVADIIYSIGKWIVMSNLEVKGIFAIVSGVGQMFGIITSMVLLVVIASSDKSDYEEKFID